MVIWRRPDGGLLLHSPICLDPEAMATLEALGPLTHIIVPCRIHRTDAAPFSARYPNAKLLTPACAREAVAEVVEVHASCEESLGALGIRVHTPAGLSPFELHYEIPLANGGRALLITDALFNLGAAPPPGLGGLMLRLLGSVRPLGITPIGRWTFLHNKSAYRDYLEELAEIPGLQALCVAHGEAISQGTSDALRAAAARV
jgi:hypothetical protein